VVINVLNDPVHVILEPLDVTVVVANLGPGIADQLLHLLLPVTVVIHSETQ